MLYLTGSIRKLGRVDHKDAFLDTYSLERARGITIFSKQAVLSYQNIEITLLDTPGHVDFSAEMERTLQVLDYAVLVISGSDGVQGHTETLWRLLIRYRIPTFLFVNKMDLVGTDRTVLMNELKKRLGDGCVDFSDHRKADMFMENLAMCDDILLEHYMENGTIEAKDISKAIAERKVHPCYFGSALKLEGVEDLLGGLELYTMPPVYPMSFGAKIYKITRDEQGNRLTHMKITGGSLKVKRLLGNKRQEIRELQPTSVTLSVGKEEELWEEKVDQIRIYSGVRFEAVDEAEAGTVCAVAGLSRTYPGEGLGIEAVADMPILEPVLNYQIILPDGCDPHNMLSKLRQLEEEDPQLHIVWSEQYKEIQVQLMGEVQIEVLKSIIQERFGVSVDFGTGNIVYKETIKEPMLGVGHFEPLRHYAEVHLLLEPDEVGSGLSFYTNCSEDILDRSWQRLVLTHLEEKEHIGVLTGSPITDMRITLIAGRAHQKHTEGGDFRQATYRAVRQGLKKAQSVLLEPYYNFRLEIPSEAVGRAMSDIVRMSGSFNPPDVGEEISIVNGSAPVSAMRGYQSEVTAYTKGRGRVFCTLKGYLPCHNPNEVIQTINYDSERDPYHPTGSVFCAHGAGFVVEWDKVHDYMHIESPWEQPVIEEPKVLTEEKPIVPKLRHSSYGGSLQEDKELEAIFTSTYGPIKRKLDYSQSGLGYEKKNTVDASLRRMQPETKPKDPVKEYLLIDGYNIIFSWEELNELAKVNMDAARSKLMDILCNYQGFKKCILILVFDAYKVKGGLGSVFDYHNIHVVYTKEAETADAYIEKVTHEIAQNHHVTVATSDALEQLIILGQGAARLSAKDLKEEITRIRDQIRRDYLDKQFGGRAFFKDQFDDILGQFNDK
jgi:translation elongation factor EF-G/predicted RNA-binding protein with PIN domain